MNGSVCTSSGERGRGFPGNKLFVYCWGFWSTRFLRPVFFGSVEDPNPGWCYNKASSGYLAQFCHHEFNYNEPLSEAAHSPTRISWKVAS